MTQVGQQRFDVFNKSNWGKKKKDIYFRKNVGIQNTLKMQLFCLLTENNHIQLRLQVF